ncbi:MAG: Uma2 family endonuclease [Cyanobacteria bacterium J06635_1]
MVLQAATNRHKLEITWDPLPEDFVLPDDPVENIQQPLLAAALNDALDEARLIQPEMLIASNFGLVATVNNRTVVKAPDWLLVPQVAPAPEGTIRRSYTPHKQGDPVSIVMEFLSDTETGEYSVRPIYPYGKLYFYEKILKVPTYVIFNPLDGTLEVRSLQSDGYTLESPNEAGRYWIPALNLWLGEWYGKRLEKNEHWLRWWDQAGNLLLWGNEKAALEHQRAEQERQKAEQARQKAEQERQRAATLAAKLRELGVDPDAL